MISPPDYSDHAASQRIYVDTTSSESVETPPAYGTMRLQRFIFIHGRFGSDYKVFSSKDSLEKYKLYKHVTSSHGGFRAAKRYQNQSIGLPLLIGLHPSGFTRKFIRLFATAPSPIARGRLYESWQDDRRVGEARNDNFKYHVCYTVKLNDTSVVVLRHLMLPIIDFQVDESRFRFVKKPGEVGKPGVFMYELYLLGANQTSLFNGLEPSGNISKDNPLLAKLFLKEFSESKTPDIEQFESPHSLGGFEHLASTPIAGSDKISTFTTFTSATDQNTNVDVEPRTLAFVAVALVVQRIEDTGRAMGSSSHSHGFDRMDNSMIMTNTIISNTNTMSNSF